MSWWRKRKPVVNTGYDGLPKEVASYFRTLDSLDPSEDMRRIAEHVKAEYRAKETDRPDVSGVFHTISEP